MPDSVETYVHCVARLLIVGPLFGRLSALLGAVSFVLGELYYLAHWYDWKMLQT